MHPDPLLEFLHVVACSAYDEQPNASLLVGRVLVQECGEQQQQLAVVADPPNVQAAPREKAFRVSAMKLKLKIISNNRYSAQVTRNKINVVDYTHHPRTRS